MASGNHTLLSNGFGHISSLRLTFLGCKKGVKIPSLYDCRHPTAQFVINSRGRHSHCTLGRWCSLKLRSALPVQLYMVALHDIKALAHSRYAIGTTSSRSLDLAQSRLFCILIKREDIGIRRPRYKFLLCHFLAQLSWESS